MTIFFHGNRKYRWDFFQSLNNLVSHKRVFNVIRENPSGVRKNVFKRDIH